MKNRLMNRVRRAWIAILGGMLLWAVHPTLGGADDPPRYSLSYSQISGGAGLSHSASYSIEDTLRYPAAAAASHRSVDYSVVNPQGLTIKANNGIAIVDGSEVRIIWPDARKANGARSAERGPGDKEDAARLLGLQSVEGYHVQRSPTGAPGSFAVINPDLITGVSYIDHMPYGTYFYTVTFVNAAGTWIDWIPIMGVFVQGDESGTRDWMFYQ